ncbi:MAG: DUF3445 domain-containing protein [Rhodobacteraceae bacterium]|nr:DUF3445 domain-containing protein [Paracoccaceae bacterium]
MILQSRTPYDVFAHRTLPGTAPLNPDEWLLCDEVYAAQMQRRVCLINERPQDVLAVDESARPAAEELLDEALMALPEPFKQCDKRVLCPDGRQVNIDRTDPMRTLGLILQEDLCLMQKRDEEHVLTAAVLCFPASWQLSEKFRRPLIGIHDPVPDYGPDLAKRVQRLFNGIRVGRPLWRFNALRYADPELFQPRSESNPRPLNDPGGHPYLRSERQCLLRLPKTQAVVFSIHTYVLRPD